MPYVAPTVVKKTLYFNGLIVGEVESTGDHGRDLAAVRAFLDERGLRKEISRFQATYNSAVAFASTSSYLYERDLRRAPRKGASVVPFIANAAFAVELYIKALAQKHGVTLRGHEVVELHKALPPAALLELDAVSPKCAADRRLRGKPDLSACLSQLNNAFVEWRYVFEKDRVDPIDIEPTIFVMQVLHEACGLRKDA